MPKFMLIYHGGGAPETPEAAEAAMAAWGKWMTDYKEEIVDPGEPVGKSVTVTGDGVLDHGGSNPTAGFSFLEVADMDTACKIAAENPMIADGGTVEIAQVMPIEM